MRKALVIDGSGLLVAFDMKLDPDQSTNPALYEVDHGMGNPLEIVKADHTGSSFQLYFDKDFQPGISYTLFATQPLVNCVGMQYPVEGEIIFGVPENPEPSDAVINEVLFNPVGDGVDFVVIMNRSGKILNLKDLMVGTLRVDAFGSPDTSLYDLVAADRLFLMGEVVVLTKDPDRILEQYTCGPRSSFCRLGSFPALNNDRGNVMLLHGSGLVIDKMEYDEEMHHPLLRTVEGVSLERLHPDRHSGDPTNWHSASWSCGYATPALPNSQLVESTAKPFALWVDPEIFSPDNDGFDDVVTIGYRFDEPGFMASVIIFDGEGRPVRSLANNVMLGTTGRFTWDGITDDRRKAGTGIYVVFFEAFDPEGRLARNLTTVVVGGRLD